MALESGAGIRHVELARIRLGVGNQLLHAVERETGICHQHVLRDRKQRNLREVPDRLIVELLVNLRRNHLHAGRRCEQRVTVRSRVRGDLGADGAARAAAIISDDLLTQFLAQFRGEHPAQGVNRAAGCLRDDKANRPAGVGLRGVGRCGRPMMQSTRGGDCESKRWSQCVTHGNPSIVRVGARSTASVRARISQRPAIGASGPCGCLAD